MAISVLILGQGFVGKYLADLLKARKVDYAATTTDGRASTIKWRLPKPEDNTKAGFAALPAATAIVITFPLSGQAEAKQLIDGYLEHQRVKLSNAVLNTRWIYLGSTRPFKQTPSTRYTPPDIAAGGERVEAEEHIIKAGGHVLNLAGLWGSERIPRNWSRFYPDKEKLRKRLADRSLHLIHGADVARAIYAVMTESELPGGRWIVSDRLVHDALQIYIGDERIRKFIQELLVEDDVRHLLGADDIDGIKLGNSAVSLRIDSSHFWKQFNMEPEYPFVVNMSDPYSGF
ncbi:hypothetical protein GGI25_002216 [Coemansia spiralis]|uniref:Uncharacterized protein n=2 Tax=Coemansia TaxID=4863 RepID=A0A9W8GB56_9FUNG|nr:hypothetical protein EDC05_000116 [Coemansia umbellata]KAJ2626018.1 hypothetical protein GGI26_000102 [Coemansia sp. RSA 1358]KAJ2678628.1 hypothetical protein GGI25_002216 [Coemansia spiralis]